MSAPPSTSSSLARAATLDELARMIDARQARVAVVGLGYVGLPLLLAFARAGFPVTGLDTDPEKVASLAAARSYIGDVSDDDVRVLSGHTLTTSPAHLEDADVVVVAVPTPLTDGRPDLALVEAAAAQIAEQLRPGQLVVLESTTYPGTTEEVLRPLLDASGLVCGVEYGLGYSPERVDPGSTWTIEATPKVVSGVDETSGDLVEALYEALGCRTARTPSPREAEMAKLIENTYRQVNIALVNELATVARELDVDVWAALEAAATKPFGYQAFWPGPGVGGHCIAVDPSYLSWRVEQQLGYGIGFVQHAMAVNNRMPAYVVGRVREGLSRQGKPLQGARLVVVGVSYKPGVNDTRESPAAVVVSRLAEAGAEVHVHDPHVPVAEIDGATYRSEPLTAELVRDADGVLLLAAGPDVDLDLVVREAAWVFDAQGRTRAVRADHVELL